MDVSQDTDVHSWPMGDVVSLLDRPVYGMAQVDYVLGLAPGTARRWIDGYTRRGRDYAPLVRIARTGGEVVTWGEFVETRLLAEYRDAGALTQRMRPAIEKLREVFDTRYPLAHARPFVAGRDLVLKMQESVGLDQDLRLVVIRNDQIVLSDPAISFYQSVDYEGGVARRIRPVSSIQEVVVDPLRQFGEPVVRSVRTEIIAEQVRAGESMDAIADIYELDRKLVEAAVRYELVRRSPEEAAA
jgi:uncharacterized protein (DUF433 family)